MLPDPICTPALGEILAQADFTLLFYLFLNMQPRRRGAERAGRQDHAEPDGGRAAADRLHRHDALGAPRSLLRVLLNAHLSETDCLHFSVGYTVYARVCGS